MRCVSLATLVLVPLLALPSAHAQSEQGDWSITPMRRSFRPAGGDTVQLTLMREQNSFSSFPIALARLRGLSASALNGAPAAARFQLATDAGSASFTGHVGGGTGSGQFDFAPNREFANTLRQRGVIGPVSDHDLFRLTVAGISLATVDGLLAALQRYGDGRPTTTELARFATHDISARVIADLGEAGLRGLSPETIIRLVNHEVDGQYVREWRDAGYRDLDAEELIRLRNHDVTSSWAREANDRAGTRLGVERLVRLRRGR